MQDLILLFQLPTTPLYSYLRPVDLFQLCASCKDCQKVILSQRLLVRESYFCYYGPLITADRLRHHTYLELEGEKDYMYFTSEYIKKNQALYHVATGHYVFEHEPYLEKEWKSAVRQHYPPMNSRSSEKTLKFKKWSEVYAKGRETCNINDGLVLGSSQVDLLVILFSGLEGRRIADDANDGPSFLNMFGYYQDAIKTFRLDALIIVINSKYDKYRSEYRNLDYPGKFLPRLCTYFGLGSCDDIRESLLKSLNSVPHFSGLYAYLNILKQQDLYDFLDLAEYLTEFVIKILNTPRRQDLLSKGFKHVMHVRDQMVVSEALAQLLRTKLSKDWVIEQILAVRVVTSIDWGWAVLTLLSLFKPSIQLCKIYSNMLIGKLNSGLMEEGKLLLIALYSNQSQCQYFNCEIELSILAVDTLVQVMESILECRIIVRNAVDFHIGNMYESVAKYLVNHRQSLIRKCILQFSRIKHDYTYECSLAHGECKQIIESLGGAQQFAQFVLSIKFEELSQFDECLYMDIVGDHVEFYDQSTLDAVSVHLVELATSDQFKSIDTNSIALYFELMYERDQYSELAIQKLLQLATKDQLQSILEQLGEEQIIAFKLRSLSIQPWISQVYKISASCQFPDNIIQIVQLCKANGVDVWHAPLSVRRTITRLITDTVVQRPQHLKSSRYWFFEGLPLFIMQKRVILRTYIDIWPYAISASESLLVHGDKELVRGLFHYIESNQLLPQERIDLLQLFCDEAGQSHKKELQKLALKMVANSKIISLKDTKST
ncbi:hypothetical protein MIR68_008493 [Amoeboaphelidium protococcarum]|nr:hypothetical protein MIR68_008493 [Amoeboaphelidium protococcarum]